MALVDWGDCAQQKVPNGEFVASIQCLEPLLKNVIGSVVSLASLALFIMLLIGGFNFLFAGGDQKKLEKARTTLTAAVIGLIVMAIAFLIIKTISTITGVTDVTSFKIINVP